MIPENSILQPLNVSVDICGAFSIMVFNFMFHICVVLLLTLMLIGLVAPLLITPPPVILSFLAKTFYLHFRSNKLVFYNLLKNLNIIVLSMWLLKPLAFAIFYWSYTTLLR